MRKLFFAFVVVLALGAAGVFLWMRTARASASPEQPIHFPHRAHTENQIDCSFCHAYVEQHAAAGIPRVSLCVSCHSGMAQDSPDAKKIFQFAAESREIPWVRLYQLPDYNAFSHKWHVRAGVACAECHGDIGRSVDPVRDRVLKMAWCIDCHQKQNASIDCVTCHQ